MPVKIEDKLSFLKKMKPVGEAIQREYGIKSTITLSQAALESNWGKSRLTQEANNLFGMKATQSWIKAGNPVWTGATTEYFDAKNPTKVIAGFKKYTSYIASAKDWANLLSSLTRYVNLMAYAKAGDVQNFGKEVTKSGYATDPNYSVAFNSRAGEVSSLV